MRALVIVLSLMAAVASAADWTRLEGGDIRTALDDKSLDYGAASQDFRASGATDYYSGRPSSGRWDVRGDQYCSVWPPSDTWACYDVDLSADGTQVRFSRGGTDETVGTYVGGE